MPKLEVKNVCYLEIGAQVNTDAKPYQIVHFKYIGFIVLQFYLKEVKEAMKKEEIVGKKRSKNWKAD